MKVITVSSDIARELHNHLQVLFLLLVEVIHVCSIHHLHIKHSSITSLHSRNLAVDVGNPVVFVLSVVVVGVLAYIKVGQEVVDINAHTVTLICNTVKSNDRTSLLFNNSKVIKKSAKYTIFVNFHRIFIYSFHHQTVIPNVS